MPHDARSGHAKQGRGSPQGHPALPAMQAPSPPDQSDLLSLLLLSPRFFLYPSLKIPRYNLPLNLFALEQHTNRPHTFKQIAIAYSAAEARQPEPERVPSPLQLCPSCRPSCPLNSDIPTISQFSSMRFYHFRSILTSIAGGKLRCTSRLRSPMKLPDLVLHSARTPNFPLSPLFDATKRPLFMLNLQPIWDLDRRGIDGPNSGQGSRISDSCPTEGHLDVFLHGSYTVRSCEKTFTLFSSR